MEWKEFTAKTVNEALTSALIEFDVPSDKVEYEVIEEESSKFLGLISKPAVIRVRLKMSYDDIAKDFLNKVFSAMNMVVTIDTKFDEEDNVLSIDSVIVTCWPSSTSPGRSIRKSISLSAIKSPLGFLS